MTIISSPLLLSCCSTRMGVSNTCLIDVKNSNSNRDVKQLTASLDGDEMNDRRNTKHAIGNGCERKRGK